MYAGCIQAGYLLLGFGAIDGEVAERHGRRAGIRVGDKHHAAEPGETPREWRLKGQPGSRSCLDDE